MKKKLILTSLLSIIISFSLIVGSTFALFTSESKVNIAVTSGSVSVVASIDETSVETKQLKDTEYKNGATNMFGGVATFGEDGLTLGNFVPGDGIKFNIVVKNESTVSVKYRTIISCEVDDGLFAGLKVDIDNLANYDGEEYVAKWESMAVGAQDIIVPVSIELPEDAGEEYEGKTCTISYKVEAVQGNAKTYNLVKTETMDELKNALTNARAGDLIDAKLTDDITLNAGNFTVAADTKVVIDLGDNDLTVTDTDGATPAFLMVEGDLTITGEGNVAVRQINASEGSKLTIGEGVEISASGFSAINNSGTLVIDGATINHDNTNANGNAIQNQNGGTLIINNATVTSNSNKNVHTINNDNGGGTIIINGGTFTHKGSWGNLIHQGYSGEIIINGGTFTNNGQDSLARAEWGGKLTINAGEFKNNVSGVSGYIPATSTATTNADGSITVTVNN